MSVTAHRANNLDALRVAGALAVILGHGAHLTGRTPELYVLGLPVSTLGVVLFFVISGYLITASWTRSRSLITYFKARILRIFPALITVVVITVFVIGPLVTVLPVSEYFSRPATWHYLANIRLEPAYRLPGVFQDLPYPITVNGSLWTLAIEFFCYLVVPLVAVSARTWRAALLALALVAALLLSRWLDADDPLIVYNTIVRNAATMWAFFAAGALLRTAHERWKQMFRWEVAALALLAQFLVATFAPELVLWVSWLFLPYLVLTIGLAKTPVLRHASRYGDLSYGLYLWGFPVQQLLVHWYGVPPLILDVLIVAAVAGTLAFVSWHLIEGPCLRLKSPLHRTAGGLRPPQHSARSR